MHTKATRCSTAKLTNVELISRVDVNFAVFFSSHPGSYGRYRVYRVNHNYYQTPILCVLEGLMQSRSRLSFRATPFGGRSLGGVGGDS